ncbi:MAG: hypothetical protein A2Y75_02120 [Candidatus Solincola sediminis]|uniref:Glyoxalase-like domain-containing protein n=1 Tax=Candidatus Solincola sediminis TaxID=1797199 RepID=A0A1F2WTF1_9ACTN|nr:MAG: hypothetical protein A2Y75_02120 [Candidatus Solincola sediminis]
MVSRYCRFLCIAALALLLTVAATGCGSSQPAAQPLVKKIDHVSISSPDPEGLFTTLTETLELPVAWPLSSYQGFTTGAANAGNVNIETIKFDTARPVLSASIYGVVFESYPLSDTLDEFKQRGADPSDPQDQMRDINGAQVKVWTNVTLNALCNDQYIVYLCEYAKEMEDSLASRAVSRPFGGIGLVGVKEISIGTTEPQQLREEWETILAPAVMSSDGVLSFDSGPAIHIVQASTDSIIGLVLEVVSLDKARDFLSQKVMPGDTSEGEIHIDPMKVQGLDITLVEQP